MEEWGRTQYEQPFTWEGNVCCPLPWSPHHAILEEKCSYRGSNPYFPAGSSECKGNISIVMPRSSENLENECCFFPEVRYPPEPQTPAQCWDLASDYSLNQNLISPSLFLSHTCTHTHTHTCTNTHRLSLCFSLLHSFSNPAVPRIIVVILVEISEPGEQSKSLPNISLHILIPHPNCKWWSRMSSSVGMDIKSNTGHHPCTLSIVRPSQWPADHVMCTVVYVFENLTQRSKLLQSDSCEGSSNNQLSWSRPHLDDKVCWTCCRGAQLDLCVGT